MEIYVPLPLYNSTICRICATDNSEGIYLYDAENEMDLKSVINRYLPLRIEDDGKLPRTICPGCHIQLASTMQFFNLIVEGQARLREMLASEVSLQKSLEKERKLLADTLEGNPKISLVTEDVSNENDILIKIFPNDPFFGLDHEMTLLVEGLDKPKRKRGRPRKPKQLEGEAPASAPEAQANPESQSLEPEYLDDARVEEEEDDGDEDGGHRLRRHRKPPQRFMEAVAGKELERILREEGAIDDESEQAADEASGETDVREIPVKAEVAEPSVVEGEVIGHLQTPDGLIAEPILALPSGRAPYRRKRINRFMCDFCHLAFKDRTRWIRHRLTHKSLRFQCSEATCLEKFTSKTKLRSHQALTQHQGIDIVSVIETVSDEQFLCGACGGLYPSTKALASHVEVDHAVDKLETKQENVIDANEETPKISNNVAENQEEEDKTVERLDEEFQNESNSVSANGTGCNKSKHNCDLCDRSFNHTSSLLYHKESFHNNGIRFACSKCPKTFSHKQLLQRHQMVHSDIRPYICNKCGVGFKTKSNLFHHRVVHTGEKKFSCETCGQLFAHKTSLNLHMMWHKGIRAYKCPLCGKCFTQNGNLREHLRIHYGEKPYNCNHCDKAFTTSSQQKLHVKRHTGERPWKCQYCGKQFLHKDTWRTHERRHTGEKPFICSYCQRAFAEHWSLKKHVRLHTGEKPYKCNICGKDFADCSNLTKHKKVHGTAINVVTTWKPQTTEDVDVEDNDTQQVIYVYNQDTDDPNNSSQAFSLDQPSIAEEGVGEEGSETGQVTTFTDEEGNPIQLPLPDGRSVEILSLDMETNIVQVRTSEGWTILLQLSQRHNSIADEDLLEQIREAVAGAKPFPVEEEEEALNVKSGNEVLPVRQYNKQKKPKPIAPVPPPPLEDIKQIKIDELNGAILVPTQDASNSQDQQSFELRLDKSMTKYVWRFPYGITQKCLFSD